MPGLPELLVILLIVVVIFGAGRLPQLGEALGRGIRNFKRASKEDDSIQVTQKDEGTSQRSLSGSKNIDEGLGKEMGEAIEVEEKLKI